MVIGDDLTLFHVTNSYIQNHTDLILGDTNHQYFRGNTSDKSVSLHLMVQEKFYKYRSSRNWNFNCN